VHFTVLNAGIGAGGAIGAAVADIHHPGSFQPLFVANALSCVVFAVVVARLPDARPAREPHLAKAGYRDVLAQRGLRTVIVASLVLAFTGYAAMDSGLPAYATVQAHVSVHVVALSITVNTAVIVAAQLLVLRLVRRLRRSRALVAVGLIWAVSWAVFGLSALWLSLLCAGCLGTALLGARLGRQLTVMQDRVSPAGPAAAEAAPAQAR
jgi:predicted MFS family arabinose efflux permease